MAKLSFGRNNLPRTILAKEQFGHSYTFCTVAIMIFSPVSNSSHHTYSFLKRVYFKPGCNNLVQIKVVQETILNGFEKMPQALIGLFNSTAGNLGKVIVKAYPD